MSTNVDSTLWSSVASEVALARGAGGSPLPTSPIQQRRRRGFIADDGSGNASLQLVKGDDDVLRWVYEPPVQRRAGARRAWRASVPSTQDVVQQYAFPELGENEITAALERLDYHLNRERGLRRWRRNAANPQGGEWQPIASTDAGGLKGRVLLLVHGTFSKSEMYNSQASREVGIASVKANGPTSRVEDESGV